MAVVQLPGSAYDVRLESAVGPLVVLFERDDAIAVPLLSQVRLGGFDVRAARTPVELFDILGKNSVSLVLVDLGNATAGRREFWVALDAQRRGRNLQVMTFRYTPPGSFIDPDFDPGGRVVADVEVRGTQEFQLIVDGLRQRIPAHGMADPAAASMAALNGTPTPFGMQGMPAFGGNPFAQPQMGYQQGHVVPSDPQQGFGYGGDPYALSPGQGAPYGAPAFGGQAGLGAPQWPAAAPASPFAQPIETNPFAVDERNSAFAQPLSANPFAAESAAPESPFGEATMRQPAASPFGQPPAGQFGDPHFEQRAAQLSAQYAQQFNLPEAQATQRGYAAPTPRSPFEVSPPHAWDASPAMPAQPRNWSADPAMLPPVSPPGNFAAFGPTPRHSPFEQPAPISDAWTPPEMDGETGVVPELAYAPLGGSSHGTGPDSWLAGNRPDWEREGPRDTAAYTMRGYQSPSAQLTRMETAPIPTPNLSNLPAVAASPADRALGNVLVEGALLTPQKLEALRGIQAMLASVDMSFRLGELALIFKFLSPDQLLAALLVSRGYVSPQQIAGLGRVKQELAASGMDYDLEALLGMFHILPPEQLRQIRTDLGWRG